MIHIRLTLTAALTALIVLSAPAAASARSSWGVIETYAPLAAVPAMLAIFALLGAAFLVLKRKLD